MIYSFGIEKTDKLVEVSTGIMNACYSIGLLIAPIYGVVASDVLGYR
jgi:hypothetical protein